MELNRYRAIRDLAEELILLAINASIRGVDPLFVQEVREIAAKIYKLAEDMEEGDGQGLNS